MITARILWGLLATVAGLALGAALVIFAPSFAERMDAHPGFAARYAYGLIWTGLTSLALVGGGLAAIFGRGADVKASEAPSLQEADDSRVEQEIVKTLVSSDGRRRVDIYRREDGLFGFTELAHFDKGSLSGDGSYWAPLGAHNTITDTVKQPNARRELRSPG